MGYIYPTSLSSVVATIVAAPQPTTLWTFPSPSPMASMAPATSMQAMGAANTSIPTQCGLPPPLCEHPGPEYGYIPAPCFVSTNVCPPMDQIAIEYLGILTSKGDEDAKTEAYTRCAALCSEEEACQAVLINMIMRGDGDVATASCRLYDYLPATGEQCTTAESTHIFAYYKNLVCSQHDAATRPPPTSKFLGLDPEDTRFLIKVLAPYEGDGYYLSIEPNGDNILSVKYTGLEQDATIFYINSTDHTLNTVNTYQAFVDYYAVKKRGVGQLQFAKPKYLQRLWTMELKDYPNVKPASEYSSLEPYTITTIQEGFLWKHGVPHASWWRGPPYPKQTCSIDSVSLQIHCELTSTISGSEERVDKFQQCAGYRDLSLGRYGNEGCQGAVLKAVPLYAGET